MHSHAHIPLVTGIIKQHLNTRVLSFNHLNTQCYKTMHSHAHIPLVTGIIKQHLNTCVLSFNNLNTQNVTKEGNQISTFIVRTTFMKFYKCCIRVQAEILQLCLFNNINQLDALNFIISLFQACTCFEHMCSKHVEA